MKLVFTKNELVTMVKTTMTIPGLMKKFLTDDYIIKTFEEKILELNKKTTAVVYSKVNDEYTIEVTEMFTLEMISEFGSLINAMITLTIGVGARMKMIADKYKVKEDDLSKKPKSDMLGDPFMGSNYTVYGTRKNIANILPNIENINYIKNVLVINNKKYHNQYYRNRIQHQLDSGYIDGLVLIGGAVYALYANREEANNISIYNVEAYDLGIIIDTKQLLGEVSRDGIMILKSIGIAEPKDIYYLFFNSIDDIKNFLLVNKLGYNRSKKDVATEDIKPDNISVDNKAVTFYDLDKSMVSNSILIKNHTICINDYDTLKTGLIRGSAQIDGLIFHNGTIYEIRPLSGGIDMAIYLVTKDNYISAGNIYRVIDTNVTSDDIIYNYEVQIDSHDDTSAMWILFFNNLDNMHLFLDKNFKL